MPGVSVNVGAERAPFESENLDELVHAAFGGCVDGVVGNAHDRGLGAHRNDSATTLFDHLAAGGLTREKETLEVNSHHDVPVILGDVHGG